MFYAFGHRELSPEHSHCSVPSRGGGEGRQVAGYLQNQPGGKLPQQLGHQGSLKVAEDEGLRGGSHEEDMAS